MPRVLLTLLVTLVLTLSACAEPTFEGSITQGDLEEEVSELYRPKSPSVTLDVTCEGGIESAVGATQTCRIVRADDGSKDSFVRVHVAGVVDDQTRITAKPFVPADRIARVILKSLVAQGYLVDQVTCERELEGQVGASVDCVAAPTAENSDGGIVATVTRVAGLKVAFDYELSTS